MRRFQMIALTPPGLCDPSIAIAASRAGEVGVLDLQYVHDEQIAADALAKLARYAKGSWGVKLDGADEKLLAQVGHDVLKGAEWVILAATSEANTLARHVSIFHDLDLTVLLETTSLQQALLGVKEGVDGLIAKGNEGSGWVGEETTFILLQRLLNQVSLPVWAQGGIGSHTSAACYASGATGVVLDGQLLLTHESPLPEKAKAIIARMDGSETICLGEALGAPCRVFSRPGFDAVEEVRALLTELSEDPRPHSEVRHAWFQGVRTRVGWKDSNQRLWLLGQDASFAKSLADRFRTVGGVLVGMRHTIDSNIRSVRRLKPLNEGSPLAQSHGTRYPIVQGPMSRVSDRPSFCAKVAEAGALPFLALGLMRTSELKPIVEETQRLLGDRPWGVGLLGFAPLDIRQQQYDVIKAHPPAFAIIAGGRPDQVKTLNQEGIHTYVHVPSAGLLKMFVEDGARRFIFEGRECGGHVGPRSSFVLWNLMTDVLLESLSANDLADCHVLFAGGIHDALSVSMVAAIAAPLAERGARVGVLLGTAYLFTEEAVSSGALLSGYQHEALQCQKTMLLESAPGHAVRCAVTPYAERFNEEKAELHNTGKPVEEIRTILEEMNLGRLRIASQGMRRHMEYGKDPNAPRFISVGREGQRAEGLYMIGEVAALRDRVCTMEQLHDEISVHGSQRLAELGDPVLSPAGTQARERPCDVAIIGMACLAPKGPNLHAYWENILNKVSAISEVPIDRFDWRLYFDSDPKTRDKVYSKWGGFLDPVPFDPIHYGMPPSSLTSIEPLQLLTLEAVRAALEDAGYGNRPFPRERSSVIIGASGGLADLGQQYVFRSTLPMFVQNAPSDLFSELPEWTEDSFSGTLLNVIAGRVANRFDLGGVNYTTDAACASSLAAVYGGVTELENETSDMVVVGGADTFQNHFFFFCFSKTRALSPRGQCRTFDESADGTCIGEAIAILVLKRLADAERDGDRIYAVIKGMGGSSDGRHKGLTAPHPEGQARALRRAYKKAGVSPGTIGLVEAHGTGTVAGDRAEIETLKGVFEKAGAPQESCALGSVKSMIGHTKAAAGVAGLIKVALALYHKVLPPTMGVEKPNPSLVGSPFYVNTELRPWIHGMASYPRRAGTSSFGFGGTNFHAVVEEYTGNFLDATSEAVCHHWWSELLVWAGRSRSELLTQIESLTRALEGGGKPQLADLAFTLWERAKNRSGLKVAIVAETLDDLLHKLGVTADALKSASESLDSGGIYFREKPLAREGKLAFLFPGQGSQHPDMLRDLAIYFPEVREQFDLADRVLADRFPKPLSAYIFPPQPFSQDQAWGRQEALTRTSVAQPALSAAAMGGLHLFQALGLKPKMVAGHSSGEYVALCAAGVFSAEVLYSLTEARGRFILEMAGDDPGTMAAVKAEARRVREIIESMEHVWAANLNAPMQTIISGTQAGVEEALRAFEANGIKVHPISVSCGFHSPLVAPAKERLAEFISTIEFAEPNVDVFSNTTGDFYPRDPKAIAALLSEHLVSPVKFVREIEAMYGAGARVFVEVGPRSVLTGMTGEILGDRPHLAVALDTRTRSGLLQLHHLLGQLVTHGVDVELDRLYKGRQTRRLNLEALLEETRARPFSPTTWMVTGGKARPLRESSRTEGAAEFRAQQSAFAKDMAQTAPATRPEAMNDIAQAGSRDHVSSGPSHGLSAGQAPPDRSDNVNRVMRQFQELMSRFLDTQREVMKAYLDGSLDETALTSRLSALRDDISRGSLTEIRDMSPSSDETNQISEVLGSKAGEPAEEATTVPFQGTPERPRGPGIDRSQLTEHVLEVVGDRTGYPREMIDLDLDLDAELGIDSIKWVEILGTLQQSYLHLNEERAQGAMEELTQINTLRGVIDWIEHALGSEAGEAEGETIAAKQGGRASNEAIGDEPHRDLADERPPRFLLKPVEVPTKDRELRIPPGSVFLITDDERGIAQALAADLVRLGGRVALVQAGTRVQKKRFRHLYEADFSDPGSVTKLVQIVRRKKGAIRGLIHLLPLKAGKPFVDMGLKDWQTRVQEEVRGLFCLAKAVSQDLRKAAEDGTSWVVAGTGMGGTFANDTELSADFFPAHGGVAGFVKALAVEWPTVCCKVVDLDSKVRASTLARCLVSEMASGTMEVEIGYKGAQRLALQPWRTLSGDALKPEVSIDSDWVIVATGGARGITAEVVLEIAGRYKPMILVLGRSPLPGEEESHETAGLTAPQALKAVLIERMQRSGQKPTLREVESAYRELCCAREMRKNLSAMRESGASVEYYQVDVRDEEAFGSIVDRVYQTHGRIDGFIHGAGVIEDKLLEDKSLESFNRVFDTKTKSAFVLSRKLKADSLKFLVFFSSIAGRFGNGGQTDYAAANEVLNKLGIYLDRQWPGRIVSMNWNPWAGAGMASPEVQRRFAEQGIQPILPPAGRLALDEEIRHGQKGQVEVIVGNGPWNKGVDSQPRSLRDGFPLLDGVPAISGSSQATEVVLTLDPSRDRYLQHHQLEGKAVFPFAVAMELASEVVQRGWPAWTVTGIRSVRRFRGITFEEGPREIRVMGDCRSILSPGTDTLEVDVTISDSERQDPPCYRAVVQMGKRLPVRPSYTPPHLSTVHPFPMKVDEVYQNWLFHGPCLQGISKIEGINEKGLCAELIPSAPAMCLHPKAHGRWIIDPVVIDSAFQLSILWERFHYDMTPLIASVKSYQRFDSPSDLPVRCWAETKAISGGHILLTDFYFLDTGGRLTAVIEEMEASCSKELNRLGGAFRKTKGDGDALGARGNP